MKATLLLLALFTVSCSTKQVVGSIAGLGIAVFAHQKLTEKDRKNPKADKALEVDTSGQAQVIGGQLVSPNELAHVTHWPIVIGQPLTFTGKDGTKVTTKVIDKNNHGDDFSILVLDTMLPVVNHAIYPIGEYQLDQQITIFKHWGKPPVVGFIDYGNDKLLSSTVELVKGDSGKAGYQLIENKIHFVWLNARKSNGGESPNVFEKYNTISNK